MKPVTEAEIGPGGEAEWQRLRRQLELAEGFWLGFIFSPSPLTSGVLRRRTELLLRGQTRRLESFHPESPLDLKGLLPSLVTPEVANAGCTWVEALNLDPGDGTERPWREAWMELVSRMNERRDALRRHLHGGLVLVAPPETKLLMREAASDLWSIRALVVELPLVAEVSPRESRLNTESFSARAVGGKGPEAEAMTEFALAESERLLAKATDDDPRKIGLLLRRVEALRSSGRTGEAVETARRARELALKASPGGLRLQAVTLHMLALAEKDHGDSAAATEHLEQAIKVLGGGDNRYRFLLLKELASLALWRGDLESALAAYEEALDLARQFRTALGDTPEALHDVGASLDKVGNVQQRLGNLPAAHTAYEEALVLARQLCIVRGDSPDALHDLSVAVVKVGDVQLRLGNFPAASAAYEESLLLSRQICAALGDTPVALRDLSVSLSAMGDVQQSLGNLQAARAAYEESLALDRQIRAALGDTPVALRDLSISLNNVGEVQQSLGNLQAARAAYEESLALRRQLRAASGDTPEALRDLSVSLDRMGDVQQSLGNLPAAFAAHEESLALRRQLRAALGDIPEALRDLSVSLDRMGEVQQSLGNLSAASAAYEESLALDRQFHELMGDMPQTLEDLAVSLAKVADIREALGDRAGAALARKEAQALNSRLKE
ncbi:MAG TPA: tetratricopeptide repeat protein [Archangium sp.]|jgi:tetratricopeptide (TPR) repeat protein|uniref:tetratricopeptide repeat protein n=1 Tax=Archangium sp. TaxID=1872627 RepID=UPI002ED79F79